MLKSQSNSVLLLGVPITTSHRQAILLQVREFLREAKFHRVATVNPEFLVLANKNAEFKQSLIQADLCVADGVGIVLAGLFQRHNITRFPGVDLLHEILTIAERDGHTVDLAIKKDGLSSYEEIRLALLKKYPRLSISGTESELDTIGKSAIVLCNYGAPMQELFLAHLKDANIASRLAMGVGGAFDFLTGKRKRAPGLFSAFGLEWLWRLIQQPSRFRRIWNAVVVFPVKVFLEK